MREIKFRAWDKVNKIYTYATLGDLICGACTESGDKKLSGSGQIWEQFTGLKDADGKEIYEGDVVEYVFNVREAEVSAIGEVCFFEGQVAYGMKNVKYNNQELRRLCDIENERAGEVFCSTGYDNTEEDQTLTFAYDYFVEDDMEILGNIHENPELLEEEK